MGLNEQGISNATAYNETATPSSQISTQFWLVKI